jgi:U3 small nucleolar ribonucleoprotein protein IMP3
MVTKLVSIIKKLDPKDPFRIEMTETLLEKLYNMGVTPSKKSLTLCDKLSVSSFCRRRLAVVLVRLNMAENMREAVTFVEQGHIRVGPDTVTDPAFLVTRSMEDFVTWVDTSKIKRKVLQYNDRLDDYDLLN